MAQSSIFKASSMTSFVSLLYIPFRLYEAHLYNLGQFSYLKILNLSVPAKSFFSKLFYYYFLIEANAYGD